MTDPHDPVPSIRLTRRQAIVRGTQAAAALAGLPAILAACGGGGSSASEGSSTAASTTAAEEISGDLRFATYPEWIGKHEYAKFHDLHPEVTIKEVGTNTTSTNGRAFLIRQNPEDYDFMLLGLSAAPILQADPKLIADLDHDKIPNLELIPEKFRTRYPFGIPTDYGKIGFGYRKDLISERPTKWADVWELAPKYSGKIVLLDGLEDCFGNVLLMLGYSGNSKVPSEIDAAKNKLLEIKPHLLAFLGSDVVKPLVKGTSVITMDYDFDIALAKKQEPNIEWVVPEEGLMAYLEGWVGIATTKHLPAVQEFMNFHLDPVNYADFVNTTGTAYIEPAATKHVKPSIANDPILAFDETTVERLDFEEFKGEEATKLWADAWAEVHAA